MEHSSGEGGIQVSDIAGNMLAPFLSPETESDSSPVTGLDGMIYVAFDPHESDFVPRLGGLWGITPTSFMQWYFPVLTGSEPDSSPAIDFDGTIYIGSKDGFVFAIYSGQHRH